MKILTWNIRKAGKTSGAWEIFQKINPDIALLQEVSDIPDDVKEKWDIKMRSAITKKGTKQKFSTAVLAKGHISGDIVLSSEYEWVNEELNHFDGNVIACVASIDGYPKLNIISVYSPAWPVDQNRLKDIDVTSVKTKQNPSVWVADLLQSALKNSIVSNDETWIVGGDYNASETFDFTFSSGNAETLERMNELGFTECLKSFNGKLTPTFRNPNGGKILHQIDHIFVSNNLYSNLEKCEIGNQEIIFGKKLSDHVPIIAEFKR